MIEIVVVGSVGSWFGLNSSGSNPVGRVGEQLDVARTQLIEMEQRLASMKARADLRLQAAVEAYAVEELNRRLAAIELRASFHGLIHGVAWEDLEAVGIRSAGDLLRLEGRTSGAEAGGPGYELLRVAVREKETEARLKPVRQPDPKLRDDPSIELVLRTREFIEMRHIDAELQPQLLELRRAVDTQAARLLSLSGLPGRLAQVISSRQRAIAAAELVATETLIERVAVLRETLKLRLTLPPVDSSSPLVREEVRRQYVRNLADYSSVLDTFLARREPRVLARPAVRTSGEGILDQLEQLRSKVENHPLSTAGFRLTLRRYQEYGTKYILAFERTLLGDEMGLGKTIQALAAMHHIALDEPGAHFFVVAPASVTRNWMREITRATGSTGHLLLGADKDSGLRSWLRDGGVAVTSYDTLVSAMPRWQPQFDQMKLALLIADEAQYAKNPEAKRSQVIAQLARDAERVCLLTGTPLMNDLGEFQHLTSIVNPQIAKAFYRRAPLSLLDPELPRNARMQLVLARAYLRRNQQDVLLELPEKTETEHWLDLTALEREIYGTLFEDRDFMGMRQAVTIGSIGTHSTKLERLDELLEQYWDEGRTVIAFSYFLDVLSHIEKRERARRRYRVLRIDGSIADKQAVVDELSTETGPALLVCQIDSGGVGLNLQAASVAIIIEPQWNPAREDQAIGRLYRMGQARNVFVHRLLARDSIDESMWEILGQKREVFDHFARPSVARDASPTAVDGSSLDGATKQRILELELQRLQQRGDESAA